MPELPEVENIVRSVKPLVLGRRITGVEWRWCGVDSKGQPVAPRIFQNPVPEFHKALCGARIEEVSRYGKNIVFRLMRDMEGRNMEGNAPRYLLIHLGMTGQLTCEGTPEFRSKHTHMVLSLDEPGRWLHYTDIRRFSRLRITDHLQHELGRLGPDPLEISFAEFFQLLRSRRAMLKSLLLNQYFLRGIGNIYADEALFHAGIHPAVWASRLTRKRALGLYRGIREILDLAIERGGSSIANYVDAQGRAGQFQLLHQVYRRTGQPCFRCGARIRKMLIASRSTHFCPRCQRSAGRVVFRRESSV
ncbi:MAG: bifunctional DNA-formamidopyrimidine glycosylase/DNA-(apurinic or apyrimidinic site) lyase [Acidobacteria bacterium]|nr:bifunctional DNA-formamidopyrimidine glycosylase/DNA-(apurinic or apyrimidinic site) lyase [Acidobacteriota bacterium]